MPKLFLPEDIVDEDHFSSSLPGFQTAWDSTSLSVIKECPRKYFYGQILGLQVGRLGEVREPNPHLTFGILYHRAHETFEKARAKGADREKALEISLKTIFAEAGAWHIQVWPEDGAPFTHNSHTFDKEKAEADAAIIHPDAQLEPSVWVPWESTEPTKNLHTLGQSVVFYYEHYKPDPATTYILADGTPAMELSFKFEVESDLSEASAPLQLCGHIDRLAEFANKIWVFDYKTSKNQITTKYFNQYSPHNQMSLYAIGSQIILGEPAHGVLIDGAQIAVGFTRFARGTAPRSRATLAEWMDDFHQWTETAHRYAEQSYWPQNDTACDKFGGCKFRQICAASPASRDRFIASDFHVKRWRPLEVR